MKAASEAVLEGERKLAEAEVGKLLGFRSAIHAGRFHYGNIGGANRLDFSAFVETSASGSSKSAGQSEKQSPSAGLQALAGFDADVSVNVGAISVNDISAADVALTATLKDGVLTTRLEHLGIDAGGISAEITADVRKGEPTFKGRVASKGLDISKLASLAGQSVPLSGTLAMDTGFAFRGLGGDTFRKTVNASGIASLRDATFVAPGISDPSMSEVKITLAEVEHVARLARLALAADEKERMRSQLDAILGYVEQLRRVDTAGIEPTAHVLPLVNVMRDDEVRPSYPADAMLANAPDPHDGQFRVPRILEE